MPKLKNPSLKQRRFVKEYIKNKGNATEAAMVAYFPKNRATAKTIGSENLSKPAIRSLLVNELENVGLTDTRIAEVLKEVVETGHARKVTASDALRALEIVLKLRDAFPSEKKIVEQRNLSIELRGMSMEELMEENKKINKEIAIYTSNVGK